MTATTCKQTITTPLGNILIKATFDRLISLEIHPKTDPLPSQPSPPSPLLQQIINEIDCYLKNPNHEFDIQLQPEGTPFQQRVWQALQKIPPGQTKTYGELAKQLNTSPRAIGQACRTNPIAIIIPCHRIIAANHLGGYGGERIGDSMNTKIWLLKHEGCLE